jgi:secreted trypsin-like serine protease
MRQFLLLSIVVWLFEGSYGASFAKLGKKSTRSGQFPYQVLIIQQGFCGGTLLNEKFVLTAAHCVPKKTTVHVHLGSYKFNDLTEPGRVMFKTTVFKKHENFDPNTLRNDLALIKLPKNVIFTDKIKPARLPWDLSGPLIGQRVVVTGWGKTGDNEMMASMLQMETIVVISNEVCSQFYEENIFESDLCTIGSGEQNNNNYLKYM